MSEIYAHIQRISNDVMSVFVYFVILFFVYMWTLVGGDGIDEWEMAKMRSCLVCGQSMW